MLAFLSPIPAMGYLLLSKDFPPGDTPYSHLKPNFNTKCYSLPLVRPYRAGAETAPLREKRPSPILGPSPARPSHLGASTPRRGGLCTPAREASAWPRHVPGRPTGLLPHRRVKMQCLGIRGALPRGRTECVPPRKGPFAKSWGLLPKPVSHRLGRVAEGRAPHARNEGTGLCEASPL
jgi:hypothetical protein